MNPLVSTGWLADHLEDPALRVADVRSVGTSLLNRAAFEAGHIPGAIFFDMEEDLVAHPGAGRHPLPDPADFTALLGGRGIGSEHRVVVYDDSFGAAAGRLWWMLRALGQDQVALLDGGLNWWAHEQRPVTTDVVDHPPATFVSTLQGGAAVDRGELAGLLGRVKLVDSRAAERYRGEVEPLDPVAGHIPTAINAPYPSNLGQDGRFLPPEDLEAHYRALGIEEGDDVVVYCGSGVTACHTLVAMEVAGLGGAKLYPGSWSDWGTSGMPIATGPEPGTIEPR